MGSRKVDVEARVVAPLLDEDEVIGVVVVAIVLVFQAAVLPGGRLHYVGEQRLHPITGPVWTWKWATT